MEQHQTNTEKKRFKTYLLEGLMIFIAVMLGFFAESLREDKGDKKKEREYINSLVNNLEQDSLLLAEAINYNKGKIASLDSLISLSHQNLKNPRTKQLLYRYSRMVS